MSGKESRLGYPQSVSTSPALGNYSMASNRLVLVLLCAGGCGLLCAGGPGPNGTAEVLGFSSTTADKLVTVGTDKGTRKIITT
jgi:hypothetical protein